MVIVGLVLPAHWTLAAQTNRLDNWTLVSKTQSMTNNPGMITGPCHCSVSGVVEKLYIINTLLWPPQ